MQGNAGMSELKRTMKHDRNCVEFAGIAHQTTPGNGTESLFMSVPGLDGVGERWGPVGSGGAHGIHTTLSEVRAFFSYVSECEYNSPPTLNLMVWAPLNGGYQHYTKYDF
jgi:hypothetical protein